MRLLLCKIKGAAEVVLWLVVLGVSIMPVADLLWNRNNLVTSVFLWFLLLSSWIMLIVWIFLSYGKKKLFFLMVPCFIFALSLAVAHGGERVIVSYLLAITMWANMVVVVSHFGRNIPMWLLVFVIAGQAELGVAQFILQRDLGLRLIGESVLVIGDPGVSTFSSFISEGHKVMRAYGLFKHPNVLAGVLVLGLLLSTRAAIVNGFMAGRRVTVLWMVTFTTIVFVIALGLLLTFSRLAFVSGLLVVPIYYFMVVLRGKGHLATRGQGLYGLVMALIIMGALISPLFWQRSVDPDGVSLSERRLGYEWSLNIINSNIWTGAGSYRGALSRYLDGNNIEFMNWQLDYVHSVPLLWLAEGGVLFFLLISLSVIWVVTSYGGKWGWLWIMPIVPILLFDHYLVTQPVALTVLVLTMMLVLPMGRGLMTEKEEV